MRGSISQAKRAATGIMAGLMLVIMLFSVLYIAHEADHNCSGEDCAICACIQQCENLLRHSRSAVSFSAAVSLSFSCLIPFLCLSASVLAAETPVSAKIRLNN